MNAAYVVMAAMSLFWPSQKQELEPDPARWATLVFNRQELELTIRVPDRYLPLPGQQGNPSASLAPNSVQWLFGVMYDYGRAGTTADIPQFTLGASVIRMAVRPVSGLNDGLALMNAVGAALKTRQYVPGELSTQTLSVSGRTWLHVAGENFDSYITLVGDDEVFVVVGNYAEKILRDRKWLANRRQVVRQVLEQAILVEMPAR